MGRAQLHICGLSLHLSTYSILHTLIQNDWWQQTGCICLEFWRRWAPNHFTGRVIWLRWCNTHKMADFKGKSTGVSTFCFIPKLVLKKEELYYFTMCCMLMCTFWTASNAEWVSLGHLSLQLFVCILAFFGTGNSAWKTNTPFIFNPPHGAVNTND